MSSGIAEELRALLGAGWRLVALESFEEDRAQGLLERVAQSSERACYTWSLGAGLRRSGEGIEASEPRRTGAEAEASGAGSLAEGLRAIAARAEPALFVLLDAHRVISDAGAVRRLRDLLPVLGSRRQALVLLGPAIDLPLELVREAARLELPLPGAPELGGLFRRVLEKRPLDATAPDPLILDDAVRGALGLTSSEAVRVFRRALRVVGRLDAEAVAEIVRHKRRALHRTPALSFHEDESGLAGVGGLGELKRWLGERRRAFSDEARSFGLPVPRGLLLLGVQGCGKSLSAKAVAREWQFPLLRLDLAAAFAHSSDSPETVIREAIQVAESLSPAVLWIDEIEKGFAATSSDPAASRVFGSFLTWLSEKRTPVFVVATANDVTELPPELLRRGRFDELFFVDLPTPQERAEILAIHLQRHGRDPLQLRIDELAEQAERLTGAELEQAVTAGLYAAFSEGRDLTQNDLANALTETVPLYDTYEERIKELRDWARVRTRPASLDAKMVDLFARRS